MSGHSKWSQIKRKKEIKDIERGKIFSKLSRLITLAVKEGGGTSDPEKNVKLRLAVERAKSHNMPKDKIERAVEKAKGAGAESLKEMIYEGFVSSGVAVLIKAATDNPNRTHSEIKNILETHGGKLGSAGSVNYLFEKCGLVIFDKSVVDEDRILGFADNIKALDIDTSDKNYFVYIPFEKLGHVADFLEGLTVKSVDIDFRAKSTVSLADQKTAAKIVELCHTLENHEDVDKVFANFEIKDEVI